MKLTKAARTHIVIGDTQVKPGVPTDHLTWIGQYIVDQFAGQDVAIVHVGDHADMESLSSYDKGKKSMEGRRIVADIEAANAAFSRLNAPLKAYNAKRKKAQRWEPERYITLGNHEHRIVRAAELDAQLDGFLSLDDLNYAEEGWKVIPFLDVLELDGVAYSHYFYHPNTGRPFSGENLMLRLKQLGRSFTMGHQQGMNRAHRQVGKRRHHGLVNGSCLTPDHKVLTADLRYVPLGDVKVGDKLTSFDEERKAIGRKNRRRFRTGTVQAVKTVKKDVFAVTLSNGKVFKTTADHRWLVRCNGGNTETFRWCQTCDMRKGTRVVKMLDEWETLNSYEAGWLAGMYDGEGCYYMRETSSGFVGQLSIAQKEGAVLERLKVSLADIVGVDGYSDCATKRDVAHLRIRGGAPSIAKVLGQLRPTRLLPKFRPEHLGGLINKHEKNPSVVSVEPLGEQDVVMIDIDEKTMIVEGYAHHNCYLHDEKYLGPQGNDYWRGIVVCHQVENGQYDAMEVSLDYLCRRYEGIALEGFLSTRTAA